MQGYKLSGNKRAERNQRPLIITKKKKFTTFIINEANIKIPRYKYMINDDKLATEFNKIFNEISDDNEIIKRNNTYKNILKKNNINHVEILQKNKNTCDSKVKDNNTNKIIMSENLMKNLRYLTLKYTNI